MKSRKPKWLPAVILCAFLSATVAAQGTQDLEVGGVEVGLEVHWREGDPDEVLACIYINEHVLCSICHRDIECVPTDYLEEAE